MKILNLKKVTILPLAIAFCTVFMSADLLAQWNVSNGTITTVNDRVGIGTSSPDAGTQLNVVKPSALTYGQANTIDGQFQVSGSTSVGHARSRLAGGTAWGAVGTLYGASAWTSGVSKLRANYANKTAYATGGIFSTNLSNAQIYAVANSTMRVAGTWSRLGGTISSFPTSNPNAIAAGVIAEDLINKTYTYAGYFVGKGHFTDNVSIGSTDIPSGYKLSVDGKVIAEEVKVELSQNWPDYVFDEENFSPMSIEEKQAFTERNKHLPSFAPEAEMKETGIVIGDNITNTVKELEEAYLYIYQLNDLLKEQQTQIETMNLKLNELSK